MWWSRVLSELRRAAQGHRCGPDCWHWQCVFCAKTHDPSVACAERKKAQERLDEADAARVREHPEWAAERTREELDALARAAVKVGKKGFEELRRILGGKKKRARRGTKMGKRR